MKKRFLLLPVLLALCLIASAAWAQTENGFSYCIIGTEARITAYTGNASDLILPDTLGGYPVTSIGVCAFRNCTSLEKIVIPNGVFHIGSNAFQNCRSLSQIQIPDSVIRIDTHAFYGCSSLKQLFLHDSISNINTLAFYGCSADRYCNPDSLTAYNLTDVGYSFTNPDYPQLTLKAYENAAGQRIFTVADCDESAVSVSFPDHVTAIERYAFFGCDQLTEMILPEGIAEIPQSSFAGCSALTQITLPGSIKEIADDAFSGCSDVVVVAPADSAGQALAEANAANGFSWQAL